jgi:uncharacterized protein YjbI with pentapeptide repeats
MNTETHKHCKGCDTEQLSSHFTNDRSKVDGKRAIFINKDLRGRDLTSENLRCAVMINCDLTNVPFMWSDLRYLDVKNCITTGIETSNADTRFTNLRDTHEET